MSAGGEHNRTTLVQLDDLSRAILVLNLDTSDDRSLTDGTEDHGVELKAEVGEGLCIREDIANRTTSKSIADLILSVGFNVCLFRRTYQPRGMSKDLVL